MKFLCLHGMGTSSAIFKAQLGPILSQLRSKGHEFVFLDAKYDCEPGKDVDTFFAPPYKAWYLGPLPSQLLAARKQVLDFISRQGPFDGVIGFSQGAALAAALIIESAKFDAFSDLFAMAVFIGTPMPYDLTKCSSYLLKEKKYIGAKTGLLTPPDEIEMKELGDGCENIARGGKWLKCNLVPECEVEESCISIPTVHIMGEADSFFPLSQKVVQMCSGEASVIVHKEGHWIPRSSAFVREMVDAIESMIESVELVV